MEKAIYKMKMIYCKRCVLPDTKPGLKIHADGICSACRSVELKSQINWKEREAKLHKLCDEIRGSNGNGYECIVPVSGGKDGSYVAYNLKHKYGMNPLTVTVKPALSLDVGDKNLFNFIQSGYSHIHISCNPVILDRLNKYGFIEKGFPYYGWLIAIMTAVIRTAVNFKIPLIFYGEDGEVEYGGSTESKHNSMYEIEYMKRIYLEGGHEKVFDRIAKDADISESDMSFFRFPKDGEISEVGLSFTHWSYFEPWDSYRNYIVAKEHCGLIEKDDGNPDTFTNFSQNDQALYALHAYMMYLKFGFGRATQDAGIEIRRGSMTRGQAINLVQMYDNAYPHELIDTFLDYYGMTKNEFNSVLDNYVNKELFEKIEGVWQPKFEVGKSFSI